MFNVISKETEISYTVFDVKDGKFLIYANGELQYVDINHFYIDTEVYLGTNVKDSKKSLFKSTKCEKEVI